MPSAKPQWRIKDSVFLSVFSTPESRLELFQAIHPDIKDVTVEDIKDATLPHELMNDLYDDLAMLVKDKLVIFVEAPSSRGLCGCCYIGHSTFRNFSPRMISALTNSP